MKDFDNPKYYFNRELSWLKFNQRVLQESIDRSNPLMEKLRFLTIGSSNLDEFFMIRVSGLRHQEQSNIIKYDAAHMDAKAQLKAISEATKKLVSLQYTYFHDILKRLQKEGLHFVKVKDLKESELRWLYQYFRTHIFPVVTPLAVDASHPFPFLVNKTINSVVKIHPIHDKGQEKMAILPIPSVLNRIIEVPNTVHRHFVMLEDVINYYCEDFFVGHHIDSFTTFRVTRDADLDIEEEATDLLREIEKSLRRRRRGEVVRVEVCEHYDPQLLEFVLQGLQAKKEAVYIAEGILDVASFGEFCNLPGYDHLRYPAFTRRELPCVTEQGTSAIFDYIREKDRLLHHPFDSFSVVEEFIARAAVDPDVLAIKQTLYRVSGDSPIVAALVKAAELGKQVTVLMEVKARFDEENNIIMARRLEKAGCHVIYGLRGLKTHSKITMVVRKEGDVLRRYMHFATGNYNGKTAKYYTDCGLLTCRESYADDSSLFFNTISGYAESQQWQHLIVAPLTLRSSLMDLIEGEIRAVEQGKGGHIIAKMNSLLDKEIIAKLYEASCKGVKIDLIVRGICTLRPGIEGVSDNITVRSIVGRFLEHHRILYFKNHSESPYYISSADWMPRNLNDRVELMVPVEDMALQKELQHILEVYLADNQKAHVMRADGSYRKVIAKEDKVCAQLSFLNPKDMETTEGIAALGVWEPILEFDSTDHAK
ncbi:polyphosphate kinase 1 [Veillonella sp. 3627]|uniref:polyphosphate kinase 1 n=2 Tax=unclassified Veillonella TaxID=2630086 RepID=UPI000F8CD44D|nr:polyphosphate kinase 1 [Veillonella sp. 3627]